MADRSTDPEDEIMDEDDYAVLYPEIIRDSQIPVIYRVEVEEGAPVPEDNSVEESGEPSHQELEYLDEEELPDGPECPPSPRSGHLDYFEESVERIESLFNSRPKSPRPRRPSRQRPRNHSIPGTPLDPRRPNSFPNPISRPNSPPKGPTPETAPPPARPADCIHNLLDPVSSTPYPLGEFLDFILPILRCGIRILHLGCRDGGITFQLARAVQPNGLVVAVNCPGENTSCAAENNKTHQLPNVQFVELKDFTWLPWENDTFDIVYASNIMAYLPPAPQHEGARDNTNIICQVLEAMHRVTKPDGYIVSRDLAAHYFFPSHDLNHVLTQALFRATGLKAWCGGLMPKCYYLTGRKLGCRIRIFPSTSSRGRGGGQEDWAENYARQLERGTVLREKWLDARVKEATIDLIRDMLCRWGDLAFSLWIGLFIGIVAQKKDVSEDEDSDSDWE